MCDIDFCEDNNEKKLSVSNERQFLEVDCCLFHAIAIRERLREVKQRRISLDRLHECTVRDVVDAVRYVDATEV